MGSSKTRASYAPPQKSY